MIWPEELVDDVARRRSIIVLGAGISRHSQGNHGARPPLWSEFLTDANDSLGHDASDYVTELIAAGDYLHACECLKQIFDDRWVQHLRSKFKTPRYSPAPIHELIAKLDSRIVFSLNFDDIYERCVTTQYEGNVTLKRYHDDDISEFLRGNGRFVVKLHGSLDAAQKLIFTQQEYSKARVSHADFYQSLDAALLSNTFIFLGCGFSDPDLALLLENQCFSFPFGRPHYFVTAELAEQRQNSLRSNRNLKCLVYNKVDERHSGLVQELEYLLQAVESRRYDISTEQNW